MEHAVSELRNKQLRACYLTASILALPVIVLCSALIGRYMGQLPASYFVWIVADLAVFSVLEVMALARLLGTSGSQVPKEARGGARASLVVGVIVVVAVISVVMATFVITRTRIGSFIMREQGRVSNAPKGWFIAGSRPYNYDAGVDQQLAPDGSRSAYLAFKGGDAGGFGTLMEQFRASQYAGDRVALNAKIKSTNVTDWAGLWMRVDRDAEAVSFDDMQNRPIKGTTAWIPYTAVLDVPRDATGIFFGVLLAGSGSVHIADVKFTVVDSSVPTTGAGAGLAKASPMPNGPVNLDFKS